MTIRELFSCACTDTGFKVSVHDKHYHYLENAEGDSVLYVDFSESHVYDLDCAILEKVAAWHITEWWVTISSGVVQIIVEEDIVN